MDLLLEKISLSNREAGLIFQINGTLSVPNPIEGAGSPMGPGGIQGVIQSGTGTVSLVGANTYLGGTFTVQSGTINLNGSVIGDMHHRIDRHTVRQRHS
jgi:autotransporter-associated beta strand protein